MEPLIRKLIKKIYGEVDVKDNYEIITFPAEILFLAVYFIISCINICEENNINYFFLITLLYVMNGLTKLIKNALSEKTKKEIFFTWIVIAIIFVLEIQFCGQHIANNIISGNPIIMPLKVPAYQLYFTFFLYNSFQLFKECYHHTK